MRRRIESPRVILLDCPLEYKKGESQTAIEITKEADWARVLEIEEEQIKLMCDKLISLKPDLVFTEKGVSDLAQHYLLKANITAIRRVRKSDNNRIARAVGATVVNRIEDLREVDVGTECGLFHVEKLGDDYFTFLTHCQSPKACTILLRGPSKDILNEIDRNLADATAVARNVVFDPRLVPGGGATEMAISVELAKRAKQIEGVEAWPYRSVGDALEVIPRTLVQNAGGNAIRVLTALRAKHAAGESDFGIDGDTAKVVSMREYGLLEVRWRFRGVTDAAARRRPRADAQDGRRVGLSHPARRRHRQREAKVRCPVLFSTDRPGRVAVAVRRHSVRRRVRPRHGLSLNAQGWTMRRGPSRDASMHRRSERLPGGPLCAASTTASRWALWCALPIARRSGDVCVHCVRCVR